MLRREQQTRRLEAVCQKNQAKRVTLWEIITENKWRDLVTKAILFTYEKQSRIIVAAAVKINGNQIVPAFPPRLPG